MALVLVVLLAALAVGALRGGRLERLGEVPLSQRRLVVLALLAQLIGTSVGGAAYPVGLAVSAALVLAFLALNRGVRGAGLVGLGVVANALVVGLNGAMPVSVDAATRAGVSLGPVLLGLDPRHEVADAATRLTPLADVVPVPLPLRPQVVSPGDVLVAAGLGQLVVLGMGTRSARTRARSGSASRSGAPRRVPRTTAR